MVFNLGSGELVARLMEQADETLRFELPAKDLQKGAVELIESVCAREHIPIKVLRSGNRRRRISDVRRELAAVLVEEMGMTLAEAARQLGVSTSAIAHIVRRNK